jgi:hypothetical protein
VKGNLERLQTSLDFTLEGAAGGPPTLSWLGPCAWTANELLAAAGTPPRPRGEFERACDLLAAFLDGGPRTSREVWSLAQEHKLSERTLRRAKRELEVLSKRMYVGDEQLSYWLRSWQEVPAPAAAADGPDDLEKWLAPLREKYPPPTPLDEWD